MKSIITRLTFQNISQNKLHCYILIIVNPPEPYFKLVECKTKLLNHFFCEKMKISNYSRSKDFQIKDPAISSQLKLCSNGQYISTLFICDGVYDCFDKSDEIGCYCMVNGKINNDSIYCSQFCSRVMNCRCPSLYMNSGLLGCTSYITKSQSTNNKKVALSTHNMVSCNASSMLLPAVFLNDLILDCPLGDDEPELLHNLSKYKYRCPEPNMYECYPGHTRCYTKEQKCYYLLNKQFKTLSVCRNGMHLHGCKDMDCTWKFKCPNSYCIPYQYVCDGQWDCWNGEDEINCHRYSCKSMFNCRHSKICIHTRTICDGMENCPLGDDELLCPQFNCIRGSECLNYGILCIDIIDNNFNLFRFELENFVFINISKSMLHVHIINIFKSTTILFLDNNNLKFLVSCDLNSQPVKIIVLSMCSNRIKYIHRNNFICIPHLKKLLLKRNRIAIIKKYLFRSLNGLVVLDLSHNNIININNFAFYKLKNVKFLNLKETNILYIGDKIFESARIHFLLADDFHLCCLSKNFPYYVYPSSKMAIFLQFIIY